MFNLFNPTAMGGRTPVILPMYDYVVTGMKRELEKVISFYHYNHYQVPNTHVLVKLLNDIQLFVNTTPETFANTIRKESDRLCRAFNIASPIVDAKITSEGTFYNRNNPEVLLSVEYDFDVKKCYDNYKRLKPVRVVTHGFTDLNYAIPDGKFLADGSDIAVITIDLALLAVQFKAWYDKERYVKEKDIYLSLHHFVQRYVLTNMVSTHLDVAIFNRALAQLRQEQMSTPRRALSFYTTDFSDRVDQTHTLLLQRFTKEASDYTQRLNSIPSLEYGSYLRSVNYPDMAPTRQVRWVMVLAKLRMIDFLLMLDEVGTNKALNQYERDQIAVQFRSMLNDKSLEMYLPSTTMARIKRIYVEVSRE